MSDRPAIDLAAVRARQQNALRWLREGYDYDENYTQAALLIRDDVPALLHAYDQAIAELAERSQTFKTLWREFELTSTRMTELTEAQGRLLQWAAAELGTSLIHKRIREALGVDASVEAMANAQGECGARNEKHYSCTKRPNHLGDHVAMALPKEGGEEFIVAQWPAAPVGTADVPGWVTVLDEAMAASGVRLVFDPRNWTTAHPIHGPKATDPDREHPAHVGQTCDEYDAARDGGKQDTVDWEIATTAGPAKQWDGYPPPGEGWEPDPTRRADGETWVRYDFHEVRHWRRPRTGTGEKHDHDQGDHAFYECSDPSCYAIAAPPADVEDELVPHVDRISREEYVAIVAMADAPPQPQPEPFAQWADDDDPAYHYDLTAPQHNLTDADACNCQSTDGGGPWHPKGDMPSCPKSVVAGADDDAEDAPCKTCGKPWRNRRHECALPSTGEQPTSDPAACIAADPDHAGMTCDEYDAALDAEPVAGTADKQAGPVA